MNVSLALAQIYVPQFIKRRKLLELFDATAKAFGCQTPPLRGLTFCECLARYAIFTRDRAEESIQRGEETAVRERLFRNASEIGQKLRTDFHVQKLADVMQMGTVIYRILGIDFEGDAQGDMCIRRCSFSKVYSGAVCRLISALDEGLFAGLSAGGRLCYNERMTEGAVCCRAHLSI